MLEAIKLICAVSLAFLFCTISLGFVIAWIVFFTKLFLGMLEAIFCDGVSGA